MFVTFCPLQPRLNICRQGWSLPLDWGPVRATWNGSRICKYPTKVERIESEKHSSLQRQGMNYSCNKFYNTGPRYNILWQDLYQRWHSFDRVSANAGVPTCCIIWL